MVRPCFAWIYSQSLANLEHRARVIVKRTLIHDNNGPLGQKKRRGTGRKHKKPTNISTSASTSRSTSRAATPAADDADRKYRAARAGTPDILLGAAETLQQQGPSGVSDGRGTTVGVKRHLEVSKHPTKRAKIPPRFSIPTKMPQVDVPLYCYCNYPAYDEMVACSGTNCQTQYVSSVSEACRDIS